MQPDETSWDRICTHGGPNWQPVPDMRYYTFGCFLFYLKLMIEYKERRRIVDEMKDELQNKITEYSKLVESGMVCQRNIVLRSFFFGSFLLF